MTQLFSIAKVSAETGIAKEVLRKWETRYGFPRPVRDETGNRLYPAEQVAQLVAVRRLIDAGMRPAKVLGLGPEGLAELAAKREDAAIQPPHDIVAALRTRDPQSIQRLLRTQLEAAGLRRFATDVLPSMTAAVGAGWEDGTLAIRDEHLYTELVQNLLREAFANQVCHPDAVRVVMATPPGEAHVLGLLMAQAALGAEGAYCMSLGAQVPLDELAQAALEFRADIVALSMSQHFPKKRIAPLLKTLRAGLPAPVELWAGGAAVRGLERCPRGASLFTSLADVAEALARRRRVGGT